MLPSIRIEADTFPGHVIAFSEEERQIIPVPYELIPRGFVLDIGAEFVPSSVSSSSQRSVGVPLRSHVILYLARASQICALFFPLCRF